MDLADNVTAEGGTLTITHSRCTLRYLHGHIREADKLPVPTNAVTLGGGLGDQTTNTNHIGDMLAGLGGPLTPSRLPGTAMMGTGNWWGGG